MEYENRMEQHYAVSKSGVLLHIKEAHDNNEDCFCPHCGCRMLKRCGNVRTWHFAHDYRYENEVEKNCSYETLPKTLPITLSLIDITRPQRIIVLGCKLRPQISCLVNDCEVKESSLPRVYYGKIHDIDTLFIDHPSARTSKEDTKNVIRLWNEMPLGKAIAKVMAK